MIIKFSDSLTKCSCSSYGSLLKTDSKSKCIYLWRNKERSCGSKQTVIDLSGRIMCNIIQLNYGCWLIFLYNTSALHFVAACQQNRFSSIRLCISNWHLMMGECGVLFQVSLLEQKIEETDGMLLMERPTLTSTNNYWTDKSDCHVMNKLTQFSLDRICIRSRTVSLANAYDFLPVNAVMINWKPDNGSVSEFCVY